MEAVIEDIQENRDAVRVEVEFPAKLAKGKGRFSLTNLSPGGVFIKTDAPEAFTIGEEFRITTRASSF